MIGVFILSLFLLVVLYGLILYVLRKNEEYPTWDDKYVDNLATIVEKENDGK